MAIDSATGDLADGSPGRLICVAYVYPDGVVPMVGGVPVVGTDHTMRVVVDPAGAKTFSPGEPCYADGRPNDERRVQVFAARDTDLEFVFFESTVTLDGQSTARFERAI